MDTGCLLLRCVDCSGKSVVVANTIRRLQESGPGTPVMSFFFHQSCLKTTTVSISFVASRFAAWLPPDNTPLISKVEELGKLRGFDGTEAEAL